MPRGEELPTEGGEREFGAQDKDAEDEEDDREDAAGADQHEGCEAIICQAAAAATGEEGANRQGALFCGAGAAASSTKVDGRRLGRGIEDLGFCRCSCGSDTILIPVVRL